MADTTQRPQRPVYRNIHVTDLPAYRLPPAGWVSILHRISGVLMFLLLPFVIWLFDVSLSSEVSYERFTSTFVAGLVAVSMNPVAMLLARALGRWDFGPASHALLMHYPDYLLVGVAVVISHVMTTLGRQVAKAREMGIDLARDSKVDKVIASGEPAGSIQAAKRQLEEVWGAKCGDTAGMTEVGTIVIFECRHQSGGTHIIEDHYIEEVINPETGEPVGYGELGERVVTSFGRGFIPAIRYRSKDMVMKVPAATCPCGRTWDLYDGGIRGRWDDMKLIRGTNVYPRAVESIVREYSAIEEFQIYIYRADLQDEITVKVEIKPDQEGEAADLPRALVRDLAEAHEGLRFNIERVAHGTLPRFELKAKRLVDDRPTAEY